MIAVQRYYQRSAWFLANLSKDHGELSVVAVAAAIATYAALLPVFTFDSIVSATGVSYAGVARLFGVMVVLNGAAFFVSRLTLTPARRRSLFALGATLIAAGAALSSVAAGYKLLLFGYSIFTGIGTGFVVGVVIQTQSWYQDSRAILVAVFCGVIAAFFTMFVPWLWGSRLITVTAVSVYLGTSFIGTSEVVPFFRKEFRFPFMNRKSKQSISRSQPQTDSAALSHTSFRDLRHGDLPKKASKPVHSLVPLRFDYLTSAHLNGQQLLLVSIVVILAILEAWVVTR